MSLATTEWVNKELDSFQDLVDDYAADIGYASRGELQWLQEHMDDVLDTRFSLSTLLQTPGRLKGAPSPRKARLMARAPQSGPLSPKSINSMNSGFHKAVAREMEYANNKPSHHHNGSRDSRMKDSWSNAPSTLPSATASTVTIFSDGSPDASFHSAEDVNESTGTDNNDTNTPEEPTTDIVIDTQEQQQEQEVPKVHELPVHELPVPPQTQEPESEFTFTSLPPREPLTAKTPGSDTVKPSATSLRVQRIRQNLEKSSGTKFSSMIIDGDDDFTKSAAIGETEHTDKAAAAAAAAGGPTRQLNSPIKLRNPHTGSPSKIGSLYPPISPSKSTSTTHNKENTTHGHFFSGAIRRAKQLLFQDDKKENLLPHPQTPKHPSANISRLMAPTASSSARSPTRSPTRSPSKLYPEIRSPTKIPEPRQPASPTRIASPVRVASGASSIASLDIGTPRVLRQPSVKAPSSTNTRTSRVPVPKAGERFTRRQADMRAKEQEAKEKEEQAAAEREKEQAEQRELARQERERKEAAAVAERERLRLQAAAEDQRRRQAAAEKKAQEEQERKERAEKAQRARREQLIRERQERLEKEQKEKEQKEREQKEREERLERERLERERLEQERVQEALLEEARLESLRLEEEARQEAIRLQQEKENQLRQQQQQQSRKRSSSVAEDEQQQSQKVHLSNMRKPLSSSTRVSQNHRVSSSIMDSPLNKPTGGSLMRQSLQRQYKTGQMGQMAQSRFGKAAEGVMISNDTIKFGSSSTTTATSTTATAAAAAATAGAGAATPLKRVGPNRPLHTTPQQFRSQRTGAFSSSMSFQAKLFKQPNASSSSTAPTPVASSMGSTLVADPMTPAASHVPVTQLPEINSDSEDDEGDGILRDWANSPELRSLLLRQQVMDPDRIFGPLPPLQMEEIFGNSNNARAAKFRGRSSSANWSRDQLSQFEIDSYSEQMGYK